MSYRVEFFRVGVHVSTATFNSTLKDAAQAVHQGLDAADFARVVDACTRVESDFVIEATRDDAQAPRDTNQLAKAIVDIAVGERSEIKVRKVVPGNSAGGRNRARVLTEAEREAKAIGISFDGNGAGSPSLHGLLIPDEDRLRDLTAEASRELRPTLPAIYAQLHSPDALRVLEGAEPGAAG